MIKRILIADDNQLVRRLVRAHLESHTDLEVCGEATDGVEAIESAGTLRPDLIILDLAMPRMNGLEAASALQSFAPRIPVILYTLYSEVTNRLPPHAGISAVVSKESHIGVLIKEVKRLVDPAASAAAVGR